MLWTGERKLQLRERMLVGMGMSETSASLLVAGADIGVSAGAGILARSGRLARVGKGGVSGREVGERWVNPTELRFSQRTAGGGNPPRAPIIREQMRAGWDPAKGPIDVIETEQGLVTFDNTRVAIAQEFGFEGITARAHGLGDPLPKGFAAGRGLVGRAKRLGLPEPSCGVKKLSATPREAYRRRI
jgi:hypothetical protein